MSIRLTGLDHVVLRVRDLERAARWYADVLGCTEERRIEPLGLVQMRAGASLIDLLGDGGEPAGGPQQNMDHFCVRVDPWDADAIAAHLTACGVAPDDVWQRYGADGTGPSMYIKDLDGNTVELKGPPTDPA